MEACQDREKVEAICSAIDKLGNLTWDEIKKEMCVEKGLEEKSADKIGELIKHHDSIEILDSLLNQEFGSNTEAKACLEELKLLHLYCDALGINSSIEYDLVCSSSGLDYYTGLIYEVVLKIDELEVGKYCCRWSI
ncbi:histidine--tRNA ligase, cytoplasmic-like [Brevipalpus obovatus]|uniref:histidine--tRNA ligase, cytoplasmic-like n=1 Tax=Brevipalpus obovatus TaxID=246614 RepID=UPI003D9F90DD